MNQAVNELRCSEPSIGSLNSEWEGANKSESSSGGEVSLDLEPFGEGCFD